MVQSRALFIFFVILLSGLSCNLLTSIAAPTPIQTSTTTTPPTPTESSTIKTTIPSSPYPSEIPTVTPISIIAHNPAVEMISVV